MKPPKTANPAFEAMIAPIDDDPTNSEGAFEISDDIFGVDRREMADDDFESLIDAAMD